MEIITIILEIMILLGIGSIYLFRKYLFSYSAEKGKNLATKEDIEEITKKVESIRSEYSQDLEEFKIQLSLLSKKNNILFDEKVKVFKKLQKRLVEFKIYCEAAYGSHASVSEFHSNLESLPAEIDKPALTHLTALHEIEQRDFVFLSKTSKEILIKLQQESSMLCSMELSTGDKKEEDYPGLKESMAGSYKGAMANIDECLLSLFNELEFPSNEQSS